MPGGAAGLQNQSGDRQVLGGFDSLPSPPLTSDRAGVRDPSLARCPHVATTQDDSGGLQQSNGAFCGLGAQVHVALGGCDVRVPASAFGGGRSAMKQFLSLRGGPAQSRLGLITVGQNGNPGSSVRAL